MLTSEQRSKEKSKEKTKEKSEAIITQPLLQSATPSIQESGTVYPIYSQASTQLSAESNEPPPLYPSSINTNSTTYIPSTSSTHLTTMKLNEKENKDPLLNTTTTSTNTQSLILNNIIRQPTLSDSDPAKLMQKIIDALI